MTAKYKQTLQNHAKTTLRFLTPILIGLILEGCAAGAQSPTVSLSATPSPIVTGNSTTLTWSSSNATSCAASGSQSSAWGGSVATSGSKAVTQYTNTTYVLTCSNSSGQTAQSVTVVSPQITVSANANGDKIFTLGGQQFVPIGVNYFNDVSSTYNGTAYKTFDLFDSQSYSQSAVDSFMSSMAANGFNYVRLWLKGVDTDNGFVINGTSTWSAYVANVVTTIHEAQKYGLHVVLTGSFPGPTGTWLVPANYTPTGSAPTNVAGLNEMFLWPAMYQALGQYFNDLLTAMVAIDPNISTGIFYIDVYNEAKFDTTAAPLSLTSGTLTFNGVNYSMSDYATNDTTDSTSRQAMMDTATTLFMQTVGGKISAVMPNVLVTASTFANYAFNHTAFDGGVTKSTKYYALRPYYMLQGGGKILDMHNYPSKTGVANGPACFASDEYIAASTTPTGTMVNATIAPIISGEFGASTSIYYTGGLTFEQAVQAGNAQMQTFESDFFCSDILFNGYAIWDWNQDYPNADTFALIDSTNDPAQYYLQAWAPKYTTTYCSHSITPSLPLQ